jgi:hypothetical protein
MKTSATASLSSMLLTRTFTDHLKTESAEMCAEVKVNTYRPAKTRYASASGNQLQADS